MTDHPITPCLWFNGNAEEAANLYVTTLGGAIHTISRYGEGAPFPAGTALTVAFELRGRAYQALNGGPLYALTPAFSLSVLCDTQDEIDRLWTAFLADGGMESRCGCLTDRFGLSWQIVPAILPDLFSSPDRAAAGRAMAAMMTMTKFDITALKAAFED